MFSNDVCEAKKQIISFNLCDVRRIQYWAPVYICDRWCLIATTVTVPFHVLLDSSFLLRLSKSVVIHLEKFSGVFFYCKSKTWKYIHIDLPPQRSLMYAPWCRQRHSLAPHIACFLPHTSTRNHLTIVHSYLSLPACLGFFSFSFMFSRCLQFPNMFPDPFQCQVWR